MSTVANQPLHLDLLSAIRHYGFFSVDPNNNRIFISIMTHQPKQVSLLNSKPYDITLPEENVQQLRTDFVLEIKDPKAMSEIVKILQHEQVITFQDLKKYGNFQEVNQNMNNVRKLISYNDPINLTNMGENIEKIENTHKLDSTFRVLQQSYFQKRVPVDVHSKLRDHFLQNEKEYKEYGMSDIKKEYNFAGEMCKILETTVSTHGVFSGVTGPISPKLAQVIRSDLGSLIKITKKFIRKVDDLN